MNKHIPSRSAFLKDNFPFPICEFPENPIAQKELIKPHTSEKMKCQLPSLKLT